MEFHFQQPLGPILFSRPNLSPLSSFSGLHHYLPRLPSRVAGPVIPTFILPAQPTTTWPRSVHLAYHRGPVAISPWQAQL
jgi:hypothetical protein